MSSPAEVIAEEEARLDDLDGAGPASGPHGTDDPRARWGALVLTPDAEWFTVPPKPRKWLLRDARTSNAEGVLPFGKVGQIIGEGGVSKTMIAVSLARAVASGEKWLGTFSATRGRVLVLLGEEDAEEVRRRLFNERRASNAPIPDEGSIVVVPLAGEPCAMLEQDAHGNPSETDFLTWLRAYVAEHGPWALIIVDPLSRFAGQEAERDNASATRFIQALESIAKVTGATVVVLHHTNKGSRGGVELTSSSSRGSSALVDGVRWQASLAAERLKLDAPEERDRLGEIVVLSFTKSNYGRKGEPLLLRRDNEHGGALVPLDETDMATAAATRSGAATKESKRRDKNEESARTKAEKDKQDAARLAVKAAAKETEKRAETAADDAAARALVAASPNATVRALVADLKADRACSTDRAQSAIARARSPRVPGVPGVPGVPETASTRNAQERSPERVPASEGMGDFSEGHTHTSPTPPGGLLSTVDGTKPRRSAPLAPLANVDAATPAPAPDTWDAP